MKRPIVFSILHDQSVFMTTILSLLNFLAVLAFGTAIAIGTGVIRWNGNWELYATIQATGENAGVAVNKIIESNRDKIESVSVIDNDKMNELMRPWINGGSVIKNYLPQMWEVKFKSRDAMTEMRERVGKTARFLEHANALHASTAAGWQMIFIATLILAAVLGAIVISVSYIARNTAMLHRRELEILNQVGASDSFVAHQMQIIVSKIALISAAIGLLVSLPVLGMIISAAHRGRVGLMATINISSGGWISIIAMQIMIIILAIVITRRTTLRILQSA